MTGIILRIVTMVASFIGVVSATDLMLAVVNIMIVNIMIVNMVIVNMVIVNMVGLVEMVVTEKI